MLKAAPIYVGSGVDFVDSSSDGAVAKLMGMLLMEEWLHWLVQEEEEHCQNYL